MSIASRACALLAFCIGLGASAQLAAADASQRQLRVCAPVDNLPLSNDRMEGFENRIADLIARELAATLRYTWAEQRAGFIRRTLGAHLCDLVIGVPAGLRGVDTTLPYYASSYVFITARERRLSLNGFDDPSLRTLRIGLEALGFEGANAPPARAISRRGLSANVVGFSRLDAGDRPNPSARIVEAVAAGEIDVGVVWGPVGGYFANQYGDRLVVTPIPADGQLPSLPFSYPIALGVRHGDDALRAELQSVLDRRRHDIQAILEEYGVPLVTAPRDDPEAARPRASGEEPTLGNFHHNAGV